MLGQVREDGRNHEWDTQPECVEVEGNVGAVCKINYGRHLDSPKQLAARASFVGQIPFFGGVF